VVRSLRASISNGLQAYVSDIRLHLRYCLRIAPLRQTALFDKHAGVVMKTDIARSIAFYVAVLTAAMAVSVFNDSAYAQDARIEQLEKQLQALAAELAELKRENAERNKMAAARIEDVKPSQNTEVAGAVPQRSVEPKTTLANGRPSWASADGKFSASLRALLQFDAAHYAQSRTPGAATPAPDLSSGTNFRRARLGVEGKAFSDWTYALIYELGGTAVPVATISDAYVQYNGFAPLTLRFGAFAPPVSVEDQGSTADLIFLERTAPADLARNIAAADGRQNYISVTWAGSDYYTAASITGARSNDATIYSDEQVAFVGRSAYRVYKDEDTNIALSGSLTYVFKVPDAAPSPAGPSNITLQISPEISVDDQNTRLVNSGPINAEHVLAWGGEAAANFKNIYAQGGYFQYSIDRRASALANPTFSGWYVQGTYVLTGERRRYQTSNAMWSSPQVAKPLDLSTGELGAWEVAARYSVTDLNYLAGTVGLPTPSLNSIRGGKQDIWTAGLNWYPNNTVRFLLNYQHVKVDRIGTTTIAPILTNTQIGQDIDIISLRTQVAF